MTRIIKDFSLFEIIHYTGTKNTTKAELVLIQDNFVSVEAGEAYLEKLPSEFSGEYLILPTYKKI